MPRQVAFLRAVNVGGHSARSSELVAVFAAEGLAGVSTFLASGNVLFSAPRAGGALARRLEGALEARLGYPVAVFLRSGAEVQALARARPFPEARLAASQALVAAFLKGPLSAEQGQRLQALRSAVDEFAVAGRELFWSCAVRQSESDFSNAVLEKRLGLQATFRAFSTLQRLAERLAEESR